MLCFVNDARQGQTENTQHGSAPWYCSFRTPAAWTNATAIFERLQHGRTHFLIHVSTGWLRVWQHGTCAVHCRYFSTARCDLVYEYGMTSTRLTIFILRVEMIDDFGQLGDLLTHFVVQIRENITGLH